MFLVTPDTNYKRKWKLNSFRYFKTKKRGVRNETLTKYINVRFFFSVKHFDTIIPSGNLDLFLFTVEM